MASFLWDDKNTQHIAEHGITAAEAEYVVLHAAAPYPAQCGEEKLVVRGQTAAGRYLQVIFVMESDADIDYAQIDLVALEAGEDAYYVIHARPLTPSELAAHERRKHR